jgi:nucleotide-binding universal stress UspA family protein
MKQTISPRTPDRARSRFWRNRAHPTTGRAVCGSRGLRLASTYRTVLVPLDGSEDAERAIGPGEWLAEQFGADLHVLAADVHADERFWYQPYLEGISGELDATTARCSDQADVVKAIKTAAHRLDPCLVCMATHGRSRSAALLGSTLAELAVAGQQPLVAIGPQALPHATADPRRIVVCVDGTPSSERLVDRAAMWARTLGHSLTLLTVTRPDDDAAADSADEYLQRLALDPDLDDLTVEPLVLRGSGGPHAVLARHLAEHPATLVATTTQGRTGPARALLGSETARIIHTSPVPVLVLPVATDRRYT